MYYITRVLIATGHRRRALGMRRPRETHARQYLYLLYARDVTAEIIIIIVNIIATLSALYRGRI